MKLTDTMKRILSALLVFVLVISVFPVNAFAAEADDTLLASLDEAKAYIDGITINNSSNDPATVVKTFKKHFTWDNEKRENSKSYLFDWSYYNGVVFEGIEFVYEVTGESVYRDYVVEYMSSLINANGGWATCTNSGYTSKQCAGYNSTHGADCYKTASLLLDTYEMTGDNRYLTMAATLYADLNNAENSYLLSKAGNNFRHTWATDPSPDLWLDGLYMILPFRAEYAKHIGDTAELNQIVSRMQWVSDNMYNSSKGLFYHAADSASSNSGTFWLRSIGWYAAAIVDIMDSMSGDNLNAMKAQLVKLVDGMEACQNASNGMWLNNMAASQSSTNPYETSGTALVCYAVMKAVNNGWLDDSYADMAILAFNGICNEKLSGSTLTDICFKGAPGSSNSTFYDNEGKGVGPFIMFYAEMLEYVNNNSCDHAYESVTEEATCVEAGAVVYTCKLCGDSYSEEIPATGIHNYESVTVDATENTDGSVTYTCTNCGDSYVEVIPATGETTYTLDQLTGTVAKNAQSASCTGAKVIITYATGRQEYTDVTVGMLKDANGNAVNTGISGKLTNLTVSYEGNVLTESFTLVVEPEWIAMPSGYVYTLDTDGIDIGANNKYLVVGSNKNYALTLSGSTIGAAAVTVDNGKITLEDPSKYEFYFANNSKESGTYLLTQDGSKSVYHSGGNMYYGTDNKGYWYIGSNSNGAYQIYDYDNMNWYLNYGYVWASNSVSRFAVSSNARTVRLFKLSGNGTGDFIRLGGELQQNYITADATNLNTVLGKVKVQTSNDGTSATGEIAVTSAMVTWDTAFNGAVAGTYTGTVTYEGLELGTITVTVTAQHNYETVTVDATCTEDGSITTTCTVCGDSSVEVIPALGHEYACVTTEATCGKDGAKVYTCARCNDTYTEVIPATGDHTYKSVTVDATCTEDGSITTTCAVCGDSSVEVIPALGHDYVCITTEATCGKDGAKVYTCARCNDTYTEVIPATGAHTYESVTVDATCTEAGSTTYTCASCGHSYAEVIAVIGHSYTSAVTAPTCTEAGFTTYTCATCGHAYTDGHTDALGHTYDSVVSATCTEDGFVVYTCETCGHSYNGEAVEAFGHGYETTVVAPTCATAGYTTYVCTTCGHTYTGDETAALGHAYEAAVTEATCTEAGFTTYTCTVCGHSYIGDQIAALGHDYESVVTAPTFETEGYTTHTCTVCGDVKVDSYVPVLSHTYETVTVDATCTEDGSVTHTCITCGYTYTEVLPALGHTYETVTTEATCTANGSIVSTCATCGNVETEVISALGHSYETTKIEPTCTENGFITYTCACGHVVTEEIPATGHSYESQYTAPTCENNGGTVYTCACGDSYTDVIAALGHSYESVSVAPTCTKEGYTTYTCATCGDSYVGDKTAALGHSYEGVVTAPTCTEGGFTTYTCTVCGDSYVGSQTSALGHSNTEVVTAPTCTEAGYTTFTCTVCGHSSVGNNVAALGHSYSCVESNGYLVYTCGGCGHSYSEKIETLTYTKVSSISSGNSYVITLVSGNKYYALSHEGNELSVVQVSYSNNQITSEITEDLVWNYSGSKLSYKDGNTTYYLYAKSSSGWFGWLSAPTLTLSTSSSSTVSFSSSKLKIGSYYLRYSSGKVSLNRSATTTYFFIEE